MNRQALDVSFSLHSAGGTPVGLATSADHRSKASVHGLLVGPWAMIGRVRRNITLIAPAFHPIAPAKVFHLIPPRAADAVPFVLRLPHSRRTPFPPFPPPLSPASLDIATTTTPPPPPGCRPVICRKYGPAKSDRSPAVLTDCISPSLHIAHSPAARCTRHVLA